MQTSPCMVVRKAGFCRAEAHGATGGFGPAGLGWNDDARPSRPTDVGPQGFFLRSGMTVVTTGFTACGEIGLAGDLSCFGFFASLLLRC